MSYEMSKEMVDAQMEALKQARADKEPSPLVIAADQLAQAAEKIVNVSLPDKCIHGNEPDYCDGCQLLWEDGIIKNRAELRTALANYKRVRTE
jgi:hypothetical protein